MWSDDEDVGNRRRTYRLIRRGVESFMKSQVSRKSRARREFAGVFGGTKRFLFSHPANNSCLPPTQENRIGTTRGIPRYFGCEASSCVTIPRQSSCENGGFGFDCVYRCSKSLSEGRGEVVPVYSCFSSVLCLNSFSSERRRKNIIGCCGNTDILLRVDNGLL